MVAVRLMASRMNVSFLQELLNSVAEQGRHLLPRSLGGVGREDDINELASALVSSRGEASGVAIAREILQRYRALSPDDRLAFIKFLARTMQPDAAKVTRAAKAFLEGSSTASIRALQRAVESPRLEFFRRLNLAPGATAEIVAMRRDLITDGDASVEPVDSDLRHLLASWFNRGFLVLRRIDWQTPATILDKIIAYEAVHEIQGWDDLRRRLDPADRRCFAFFHPSLVDEPLIFVEVALMADIPESIGAVLQEEAPKERRPRGEAHHCGVLFDLELPGRLARDFLREFPDQAGGRGPREGTSEPEDLRHALAGAEFRELACLGAVRSGMAAC